jgi:drug/metabolite transporter (DMT)-like permease
MAEFLALLAAVAFGLGTALQQKGTLETEDGEEAPSFLVQILHEPVWLFGGLAQVAGWILQAVALSKGSLLVVQSLTTLSLVIALPFGARFTGQRITRQVVAGAIAVVAGIVLFLTVGSPEGGTNNPSAGAWWAACLITLVLVLGMGAIARRQTGAARALLFGCAAGLAFALQASVTKEFMGEIGHGVLALLGDWTVYVLIASALIGFITQQSALKTGVLAPAIASSNAVTLFASVLLGILIFGERLQHGNGHLVPAVIGLAAALVGIVVLAGAPPPDEAPAGSPATGPPASDTV